MVIFAHKLIMIDNQLQEIQKGIDEILVLEELQKKLKENRPLIVKAGFDPTAPELHFGHTVLLNKMKQFQDFGHAVCFLIGDFTGLIGDPTGKNKTRPLLSKEQITANANTYKEQVFKILDAGKTKFMFNSQWMSKFSAADMIWLSSKRTVSRMLERDDFAKRFKANKSISIHEFLYPLVQAYDSVAMKADIELGGTDQKFNLLTGRELQKSLDLTPQVIITMPLLEGTQGVNKMSKSLDNYIALEDSPKDMFGKLMSISDELMWHYIELLSFVNIGTINKWQQEVKVGKNPKEIKINLAMELVARFHSLAKAKQANEDFHKQFSQGLIPSDIETFNYQQGIKIINLLKETNLTESTSQAIRLIKQGAVRINQKKIDDKDMLAPLGNNIYQVGKKKFAKVVIST